MDVGELAEGTDIAGRYEVRRKLGGGGSAQTYAAVERASGRLTAIKIFTLRGGAWKSFELFEREAQVLARLDHPAIPKLVESFTAETASGPTFYLVESFVDGMTLAEEARFRLADEATARRVAVELLAVLSYLQRLHPPVIHRDLKPANVLRTPSGSLSLIDFGSVRAKDPGAEGAATTIVGTYGFMAPEQYRGIAVPATDLHGLGATLVYLLTGRAPDQLPQRKLRPELPADLRLTPHFKAWLDRLLEPAPEDRFQSADEAALALVGGKMGRAPSRIRTLALLGVLALLSAGTGALVYEDVLGLLVPATPAVPQQAPGHVGMLLPMPELNRKPEMKKVTVFNAHADGVSCIRSSPDGKLLLTGAGDHSLKLWSTETWGLLRTMTGHSSTVFGCGFSADGKNIVSTGDRSIHVFDTATGAAGATATAEAPLHRLFVHGDRVIVGSAGNQAQVWKLPDLSPLPSLPFDGGSIGVASSPDGSSTALAGKSGVIRLFTPGSEPVDLRGHVGAACGVAFSPDGTMLASSGDDGMVRLWDVRQRGFWRAISGSPNTEAWSVLWTPDGGSLLVGDKAGGLTSFRMPSSQIQWRWNRGNGPVSALSLSNDGKYLFIGSMQGAVGVLAMPSPVAPESVPRPLAPLVKRPQLPGLAREAQRLLNQTNAAAALDQAETLLTKAIEQNPRDALAYVQLARVVRSRGYISGSKYEVTALEQAKNLVEKALALEPAIPEAHVFLARLHTDVGKTQPASEKNRFDPARSAVARVTQLEPLASRTFTLQAFLSNAEGALEDASRSAQRAVELATDEGDALGAYEQLAEAYEGLSELDAADICHRRRLELDQTSAWMRGNYAIFLQRRGHLEEAKKMVDAAIRLSDYPLAHHYLAGIYSDGGIDALWSMRMPREARRLFEDSLKENPRHGDALYGLVAVEHYEASLKGEPCATCADKLAVAQKIDPRNRNIQAGIAALGHVK